MTECLSAKGVEPEAPSDAAIARVFREESGVVLASLISRFGDFHLAEDALQDALALALQRWPREGVPARPAAWPASQPPVLGLGISPPTPSGI